MKWIETTPNGCWQEKEVAACAPSQHTLTLTGKENQTVEGFGGCFNELGYIALEALEPERQAEVLDALFGKEGCAFNWGRIPIGADDYADIW